MLTLTLAVLPLLLSTSFAAVRNNATESISAQPEIYTKDLTAQEETNQASNGGRKPADTVHSSQAQNHVGCRELRSTKYISDGQCTSVNPIKELVCAGECLPKHLLPNWIGGGSQNGRYWSRREEQEWRCVIDRTRTQRIRLQCHDSTSRTYKITVVTSCKCKRYNRQQNDSAQKDTTGISGKHRRTQISSLPETLAETQAEI